MFFGKRDLLRHFPVADFRGWVVSAPPGAVDRAIPRPGRRSFSLQFVSPNRFAETSPAVRPGFVPTSHEDVTVERWGGS